MRPAKTPRGSPLNYWNFDSRSETYIVASTHTSADGRWQNAMVLGAGEYVLHVFKAGAYTPTVRELVVG